MMYIVAELVGIITDLTVGESSWMRSTDLIIPRVQCSETGTTLYVSKTF